MNKIVFFLPFLLLLSSCEKIDLDAEEAKKNQSITEEVVTAPLLGLGKGTESYPFTPDDVLCDSALEGEAWVLGYVVGATKQNMKNAEFSPYASSNTCILLSSDSLCTDIENCIPAQLEKDKVREQFSLTSDHSRFRRCVLIHGVVGQYMRSNGLRSVDEGRWMMSGFVISSLYSNE